MIVAAIGGALRIAPRPSPGPGARPSPSPGEASAPAIWSRCQRHPAGRQPRYRRPAVPRPSPVRWHLTCGTLRARWHTGTQERARWHTDYDRQRRRGAGAGIRRTGGTASITGLRDRRAHSARVAPMSHRCGSSDVSIRVAGRVVPVMHLIAFRRLQAGPADHHDGALPWSEPPRCSTVVVAPSRHRAGTGPAPGRRPGLRPVMPGMPVRRAAAARPPSARVPAARLRRKSPRPLTSLRKSRIQVASGQNINFPILPIGKMGNGEGARRIFG